MALNVGQFVFAGRAGAETFAPEVAFAGGVRNVVGIRNLLADGLQNVANSFSTCHKRNLDR